MGRLDTLEMLEARLERVMAHRDALGAENAELRSVVADQAEALEVLAVGAMRIPRLPKNAFSEMFDPEESLRASFVEPWEPIRVAAAVEMEFHWPVLRERAPAVYHEMLSRLPELLERKIVEEVNRRRAAGEVEA